MKWTKYDPSNPPQNEIGKCLFWMLDYGMPAGLQYVAGVYDKNKGLLTLHGNKGQIEIIYSPEELVQKKAHYILPSTLGDAGMNNLELRKCKVTYKPGKEYYFHKWIERGATKYHGEDPQKDSTYVETSALVEDINTGETSYASAECIVFIR